MPRSTRIASVIGALLGAVIGLGVVALAAGRVLDAGVGFVANTAGASAPAFVVGQAGMYLLVAVAGALGGLLLGLVGYAVGRESDPEAHRFGPGPMAAVAAGIGAAVGFGAFRAVAGIMGHVVEGTVTLTVFRATLVALIAGAVTGAVTAGAVERLARPEVFGFTGAAWPSTPGAFVREAAAAVGLPVLGVVVGVSVVYVFSRVLLNSDKNVAVVLFGGVAAIILFGAAAVAAMGNRRSR